MYLRCAICSKQCTCNRVNEGKLPCIKNLVISPDSLATVALGLAKRNGISVTEALKIIDICLSETFDGGII